MNELPKRLSIIRSAIEINEKEIIESQLSKLKGKALEREVREIIENLERLEYELALSLIEEYLKKLSALTLYQDPRVQALKLKLKALEDRLCELTHKRDEYLKEINEFNVIYYNRLGNIISEILHLREQVLKKRLKEKQEIFEREKRLYDILKDELKIIEDNMQDVKEKLESLDEFDDEYDEVYQKYERLRNQYAQKEQELKLQREKAKEAKKSFEQNRNKYQYDKAKAEYEEFKSEYNSIKEELKNIFKLSKKEQEELKKLYRKASRMCHPDLVINELKVQAITIMQELNEAYEKRDLQRVKSIWQNLQSGLAFDVVSEKIDDKDILEAKIAEIKLKIDEILKEIEEIESDETFRLFREVDDMDTYLDKVAKELEAEKMELEEICVT